MSNNDKALSTLEYTKVLELLASCALTDGAKEYAASLRPDNDPVYIQKRLDQTTDAKRMASIKGAPSFYGVNDITTALERADKGATLSTRELLDIAGVLTATRRLLDYFNTDKTFQTSIDEVFGRLTPERAVETKITRAIVAEDMISDDASPALAEIRRKIRNTNNHIKDVLQKYTSGTFAKYLQDNLVTMRNGRYVVPVKNEYKNEIKGLIHDTSASGATMFIEPLAVVESNNQLRELESREKHEIERILVELSADCAAISGELSLNYMNLTELAFIFAKAELSFRMDASAPMLTDKRELALYNCRHPLLKNKVVPVTITLGGSYDTLVITGPNTGGKTVTLKTIGLFALMVQSGLHIPADDSSQMCIFDDVLADIGDEQSIEQSLSTFSAHMVNIVSILGKVSDKTLVLLDELGAGTDPIEGAALAISILEKIRASGALCAATTHYAELKAYALQEDGVCNASCEFDVETLRPTYRLIIGTPGRSNAFAISQRLGIDADIIEHARTLISGDRRAFEDVIEKLEQTRIELEHERAEALKARREYEEFRSSAERKLNEKLAGTEKEIEKNRAKAISILESARSSSEYVLQQLEEVKKQRETAELASSLEAARKNIRNRLKQTDDEVNPVEAHEEDEDYIPPRPYKKGDEVRLVNINQRGVLLSDPDKDGNVQVQAGIIKTKTNISNLRMIADSEKTAVIDKNRKKLAASAYRREVSKSFSNEIDVRGMNGEDAWFMIDRYIDDASVANIHTVRIIHGKGTGALKNALWKFLRGDKRIESFRLGGYGEGDLGVTILELK